MSLTNFLKKHILYLSIIIKKFTTHFRPFLFSHMLMSTLAKETNNKKKPNNIKGVKKEELAK